MHAVSRGSQPEHAGRCGQGWWCVGRRRWSALHDSIVALTGKSVRMSGDMVRA